MADLKMLTHLRGQAKAKITRIRNVVEAAAGASVIEYDAAQLKVYSRNLEGHFQECVGLHHQIVAMSPVEKIEDHDQWYLTFEEQYNETCILVERMVQSMCSTPVSNAQRVELPPIDNPRIIVQQQPLKAPIPTFDGKPEHWPRFKAMFCDVMRASTDSDCIKLYHLERSLVGAAAGIIDARTLNDNNYSHAWEILEERFENKRVIVDTHIQGLLNLQQMCSENPTELRELIDEVTRHVDGLAVLKEELVGVSERFVVNLMTAALDKETRKMWEASVPHKAIPSYEDTINFLKKRCAILERCESAPYSCPARATDPVKKPISLIKSTATITANKDATCELCAGAHHNFRCEVLRAMSVPQRQSKVRELRLCYNCLRKGHQTSSCNSTRTCQRCQGKHHTLLHLDRFPNVMSVASTDNPNPSSSDALSQLATTTCSVSDTPRLGNSLLMTAVVSVLDSNGKFYSCRAFLDCGSQANLVSSRLIDTLNIPRIPANIEIIGANDRRSTLKEMVKIEIRSMHSNFLAHLDCLVTNKITGVIPSRKFDTRVWPMPSGLPLADPTFHTPGEVDLLIGINLFFKLLMPGQLQLSDELPILQETRLGWIVAGSIDEVNQSQSIHQYCVVSSEPLSKSLERFWSLEAVESPPALTNEEKECEEIYCSTTRRNTEGRYIVQLPLKDSVSKLNNNRSLALRRFLMLEQRFKKNPEMKQQYVQFIDEYKALGHCKQISEFGDTPETLTYYLPHHAVLKPTSSSTKLRVVFDASAKYSGLSLNEILMTGPIIQDDLFSILLRFRRHRYACTADISKMYRQISVDSNQTSLQRIFWRKEPSDPLEVLELTTVTYGTSSAPFLAIRTLHQLASDELERFPTAARIVNEHFYVDDALFGADTIEDAIQYRTELTKLLNCGGFPIHKWCANEEAIIQSIPDEEREKYLTFKDADINQSIKTLGLLWDPKNDVFMFLAKSVCSLVDPPTKRRVLSEIAKLFDPLGLLSPIIMIAKVIMQQIWLSRLHWDDMIDGKLLQDWHKFRESLHQLHQIKIPRYVGVLAGNIYEIHGFADASNLAYGACIYIRAVSIESVKVSLLCSKSKIAPLKGLTIPRMELCAVLLLSRLSSKVIPALKMEFNQITYYSDSQIVLAWLKKPPNQLNLFVRNRIMEITNQTQNAQWKFIRTEHNPADVVSRGQLPSTLANNQLWWNGPPFLQNHEYHIEEPDRFPDDKLPEWKSALVSTALVCPDILQIMTDISSFRKLQRIVGYVMRFFHNSKSPRSERIHCQFLTIPELKHSMQVIVRYIQHTYLINEINALRSGEPTRRLIGLSPILNNDLLRVGGRLQNSLLPYEAKHQLVLPDKNTITESLIRALHEENLHVGPSGLISIIRQRFWLLNARNTVRKVIRSCVVCFRANPQLVQPTMGNLPEARVVPAAPFAKTGLDFAGPVFIRQGIRKTVIRKAYISLFICMTTKAIHFELVSDLSSAAFIAALHRFVARRGLIEELHSDHGTNFVGAKSELHELYLMFKEDQMRYKLNDFLQPREITWKFIPPRAPNFGGLWEAGVKSTKTHLKKILGGASLTFEEYYTVLTQIEAILNSRPLFAHSTDPTEPEAITPAHFLVGRPLTAIPEPILEEIPINRLTRWQHLQQLRDHFWRRWSKEYLNTLQSRQKWTKASKNVTPGVVVLLKEDNLPPQSWRLGKIVNVYPGIDSTVRVVDVQTSTGLYRRPVSKLAPLPIETNLSNAS
ncbi:uncharacterized protein LOC129766753 [Toxorhynchites rutilus septentrionalis]|nr:uncharacterized protein LOC129766150 [Toxorhynchites rutilus septentrionalis]XP_055623325.1 uncharacterized protein LOC129766753 [Toxorhynchites rutilus septentrionalis]